MKIISSLTEMSGWSREIKTQGGTIALVPTMGFFHDGHLALMREAGRRADFVVVSLFVNPSQFGPGEDLESYPRDQRRDEELAKAAGVDLLFCPQAAEMYPAQSQTTVTVAGLTQHLCGASRPGHFNGVTTVVAKLFNLVRPHLAIFGQKDLQQLLVIKRMVSDLNFPLEIIAHPIVREDDGLAMSSRNSYLNGEERSLATGLSRALTRARELVAAGGCDVGEVEAAARGLLGATPGLTIDYLTIIDDRTLEGSESIDDHAVLAMAVWLGKTRLIDNGWLLGGE